MLGGLGQLQGGLIPDHFDGTTSVKLLLSASSSLTAAAKKLCMQLSKGEEVEIGDGDGAITLELIGVWPKEYLIK